MNVRAIGVNVATETVLTLFTSKTPAHKNEILKTIKQITHICTRGAGENVKIAKVEDKNWLERQGYSKKILFTEVELKSKGHFIQIVKNEAHTEIKPHYHQQTIETYYVLKGKAILFCGDKRFRSRQGDALICEPGEIHGVVNDTDEEFRLLVLKINAKENDLYWVK